MKITFSFSFLLMLPLQFINNYYLLTNFSELGLSASLLQVLPELNLIEPSKIQQQAIPILIKEKTRDFIGLAQTGTGKTAAFGLPLLDAINVDLKETQALVLAPTRELGQQIAQQIQAFSKYMKGVRVQVVYGGASIVPQMKALKNTPHIVIATPGRLLDLINRKAINLSGIRHVVFDEADEMLNMGFREDIDTILSFTQGQKSTWLFSATMAPEIKHIVNKYMDNPNEVRIDSGNVVNQNIEHKYFIASARDKIEVMKRIIELEPDMRGIVFCRTKLDTQNLAQQLQAKGLPVDAIHGDLSQSQRDQVMKRFKNHSLEFLIATDVAARGIDVNDLTHVVHYSMPDDLEYYTHRSGRTGRAGKKGISISIVNSREQSKIRHLEKKLKLSFSPYVLPEAVHVENKKLVEWANKLVATEVDKKAISEHMEDVHLILAQLTKEQMIEKLVAWEITELGINKNSNFDSSGGGFGDKGDRGDRGDRGRSSDRVESKNDRYFVNLGNIDGINKGELADFVAETSGLDKKLIEGVIIEDRRSYFELEKGHAKTINSAFAGLFVNDREIRVNLDRPKSGNDRSGRRGGRDGRRPSSSQGGGYKGNFKPKGGKGGGGRRGGRR
uniref:DEAD/DEAH box helicase n=1 Tax=Fulvivirga sp. TaxID=1931237 RepID=UPI004049A4A6